MAVYKIISTQKLPISIGEAWAFFSSPENLATITPPHMGFKIKKGFENKKMFKGMFITYTVKPLLKIPITWVTEIIQASEPNSFIDFQLKGPYRLWHHIHSFREVKDGGIEIYDEVKYVLPFGFLGRLMHWAFIRKEIESIFEYRKNVLVKKFGNPI
ncbi:MAG: SRPBCC family protein [Bacteroidetes bacterium]|nr:SRPBCC family protein [Bacteroidota bacterium]